LLLFLLLLVSASVVGEFNGGCQGLAQALVVQPLFTKPFDTHNSEK
jgi:hypothetical protein